MLSWRTRTTYLALAALSSFRLAAAAPPVLPDTPEFRERFESRSSSDRLVVHTPRELTLPREWLRERAGRALIRLEEESGLCAGAPIDVVFAGSEEIFHWVTGGLVPEWGTGAALSEQRLIVVQYSDQPERLPSELERVLMHEFSHVLLSALQTPAPRWFDEGHAMFRSQQPDPSTLLTLARAAVFDRLIPLPALADSFPTSIALARLAYAQSYDAVRCIEEWWGHNAVEWLLSDLAAGMSFDQAMMRATGHSPAVFGALWAQRVRARYGLLDALGGGTLLWALLALVALLGAVGRRMRLRRRRQRMDDSDPLDEPSPGRSDYGPSGRPPSEPSPRTDGRFLEGGGTPEG